MVYLTWGIGFNGIFLSQVIGVCRYLSQLNSSRILLISFVPYPGYKKTKKKIRKEYSNSIIIPMIPSRNHWWPLFAISSGLLMINSKNVMTRGVIANKIAMLWRRLGLINKVTYDGRGALKAEWSEYDMGQSSDLVSKIGKWEQNAVLKSNFRLSVSKKLVEYWYKEYNYLGIEDLDHVIIPCTVNTVPKPITEEEINNLRTHYSYKKEDIILVYSGSSENWQSFSLLDNLLSILFNQNENIQVLFLAKIDLELLNSYQLNRNRFKKMWVNPDEVSKILSMCDFGLLIREDTVTNYVASPTKFAEYLSAGLKVIISPNVGDFSELLINNNLGIVYKKGGEVERVEKVGVNERNRMINFANSHFTKEAYQKEYNGILKWKK